jgi:hypothetical protein
MVAQWGTFLAVAQPKETEADGVYSQPLSSKGQIKLYTAYIVPTSSPKFDSLISAAKEWLEIEYNPTRFVLEQFVQRNLEGTDKIYSFSAPAIPGAVFAGQDCM